MDWAQGLNLFLQQIASASAIQTGATADEVGFPSELKGKQRRLFVWCTKKRGVFDRFLLSSSFRFTVGGDFRYLLFPFGNRARFVGLSSH